MSATVVCPSCHHPSTFKSRPIASTCPNCRESYTEAAIQSADRALRRERPILLTLVTFMAWFMALGGVLAPFTLAPGCKADFSINDRPVDHEEWVRVMGPFIAILSPLSLVLVYATTKERSWSRHAILAALVTFTAMGLIVGQVEDASGATHFDCSGIVLVLLAGVYLYAKQNVVDYYAELRREAAARRGQDSRTG